MNLVVRRVGADEGKLLSEVRLAALLDTPTAFGSTYAFESTLTESDWSARAEAAALGIERVTFLAESDDGPVGLAGGYRQDDEPGSVELVSMWTAPTARRGGVGRALVDAVLEWASSSIGADRVTLWVTRGNESAIRFYEGLGFVPTREYQPLPSDPCQDEIRMAMDLPG